MLEGSGTKWLKGRKNNRLGELVRVNKVQRGISTSFNNSYHKNIRNLELRKQKRGTISQPASVKDQKIEVGALCRYMRYESQANKVKNRSH